jgi:hypothetical protein
VRYSTSAVYDGTAPQSRHLGFHPELAAVKYVATVSINGRKEVTSAGLYSRIEDSFVAIPPPGTGGAKP